MFHRGAEDSEIVTGISRSDFSRELFMFATKVAPTNNRKFSVPLCLCASVANLYLSPKIDRYIKEHEAAVFYVYLQCCPMVEAEINIAGYCAEGMAFIRMLRRFEITVAVIPGQQHMLWQFFVGKPVGDGHCLQVISG